jgi:hypothetical protein
MRKAVPILLLAAVLAAGCGDSGKSDAGAAAPTPSAAIPKPPSDDALAGYSEGVQRHYAGANLAAADDPNAGVEERYFQPPRPAEAGLGETIVLTGSNIGVQIAVTVDAVKRVEIDGTPYQTVELTLKNSDGITVLDGELKSAALTYPSGTQVGVAEGVAAPCSNGFDRTVRVVDPEVVSGCLVFPAEGDEEPERFQLALETVPVEAGGIWNLR